MAVTPKRILDVLGYRIDDNGNVSMSDYQLAVVSLQPTMDGGVLRIHGSSDSFFYRGDDMITEDLAFPARITSRYIYFESPDEDFKIAGRDFTENMLHAFAEYNNVVVRKFSG
jgi:hypothetical protein